MKKNSTRNRKVSKWCILPALLLCTSALSAQTDVTSLINSFSWREVGPANPAGRIVDVEAVEGSSHIIYAGAATGGLWKTVNSGITWEPIFDDQPTASIGDIGLSQSNSNILYVGTGEANNRNSSPWGDGMYKSTDAGETWAYVGLRETRHIARVLVHPTNADIVYVAAMGHLWATNEERGVFKTTDGGQTWEKVFYINDRTGATDIAMDPVDTDILYVAMHERLRDRFDAGDPVERWGPDAGIYVSRNGGVDWTRSTVGLPTTDLGRLGIAAARSAPGTVYALIGTRPPPRDDSEEEEEPEEDPLNPDKDGIFKSTDYGVTWVKVNDWNNRPSYYSQIRVDPNDENVIWGFASPMAYSDDGGITVKSGPEVQGPTHIDYHSAWIDPDNSDHVIVGGDGGINVTWDRGKHWEVVKQFGLAQCYAISVDMRKPYYVVVGLQDNGVWVGASRGKITRGVTNADWFALSNADGFYSQVDPTDFNIIYAATQGGSIYRQDLRTGQRTGIRPSPPPVEGEEPERYHFDWNAPFQLSPHNHQTLYMGGKMVFKSVNRGDDWEIISPELAANPEERYSAIVSVSESPINAGMLWAGTNDGNIWVRQNETAEWTLVSDNIEGVPPHAWVKRIEASHHEPGRAYAVFDMHRWNNFAPYVYMTDDFGQTWTDITNDLPEEGSIYIIREDYKNPNLLFTGSEFAIFISIDRGATWSRFMNNMPTAPVHDLIIHPRDADLIVGTHGRGAWITDNITPLQQLTDSVLESDVHLFDVRPEVQWLNTYEFSWTTQKRFYSNNPPTGSKIVYYLGREYSDSAAVEIMDITGKVVRTLAGATDTGINTVFWDQREPPPPEDENDRRRRWRGPRLGALLPPGEYYVRLTVGDEVRNTKLVIEEHVPGYLGR